MPGIVPSNLSDRSMLRVNVQQIVLPLAANTTLLSSATGGGASASQSISATAVNTFLNLSSYASNVSNRVARLPTITITDAAFASPLSVTVEIVGRRFGKAVRQRITATSTSTTPVTVAGARCLDEFVSFQVVAISNNTTSDTIGIGVDGTRMGLCAPIKNIRSVKFVEKIAAGVPDTNSGATAGQISTTAGVKSLATIQQATVVYPLDSSIDFSVLFGSTPIANTDRYYIEFLGDGGQDEFERSPQGKKYN